MLTIIRNQFLDLALPAQTVAEWFKAWLAWRVIFLRQNPAEAERGLGVCRVVCSLGGYPHAQVESAAADWKRFLPKEWFEGVEVGKDDLLVARSIAQKIPEAKLDGVVSALFSGMSDGMAVMLELVTWDGGEVGPATTQEALVFYGLAEDGQFLLKAIWTKSLPHDDGATYAAATWPDEEATVNAFQRIEKVRARVESGGVKDGVVSYIAQDEEHAVMTYLALRALTGAEAERKPGERTVRGAVAVEQMVHAVTYVALGENVPLVFSPAAARNGSLVVKVFFGTTGLTEKFTNFLKRAGGLFIVTGWLVWLARSELLGNWRLLFWILAVIAALMVAVVVGWKAYFIWMYRTLMKQGLAKVYNAPWAADEVTEMDARFANQPTVRKFSADLEALGGRHVINLDLKNTGCTNLARVYFMPESKAYFYLSFIVENPDGNKNFPALGNFLVRTLYEDGVVVATVDRGNGFKQQLDKGSCSKMLRDVKGVKDMLERHVRVQKRFGTKAAGPIELSKEAFIAREKSDHVRISELNHKYGYYRLVDAIGDSFGWIRRDSREPK
ncbi:MAG TPA: hypothetical protein VM680_00180 [Verrucomicrobiae bacterium]|nr:hypothetical protein [Verrucomicrobiae bacterium]